VVSYRPKTIFVKNVEGGSFPERTNQNEAYAKTLPKWSYTAPYPKTLHEQKTRIIAGVHVFHSLSVKT
jgi:hypothetical protein